MEKVTGTFGEIVAVLLIGTALIAVVIGVAYFLTSGFMEGIWP